MNLYPLLNKCLQTITDLQLHDPLRPVHVIVPSIGYLRCIQRTLLDDGGAMAGVHVTEFRNMVLDMLETNLAVRGLRYLDTLGRHDLFHGLLSECPLSWCAGSAKFRVMPDLLARALGRLRLGCGGGDIEKALGALGEKGKDLSALRRAFLAKKKDLSLADYPDMVDMFLEGVQGGSLFGPDTAFVLFPGIREELSHREILCLDAIGEKYELVEPDDVESGSTPVDFFIAPFDTMEAREIAGRILGLAGKGAPFEDMAIICPDGLYLSIMAEELETAGIPAWAPGGVPAGKQDAAALFEALFGILESDFDFQEVKRFLLLGSGVPWMDIPDGDDDAPRAGRPGILRAARKYGAAVGYGNWIKDLSEKPRDDVKNDYTRVNLEALSNLLDGLAKFKFWPGDSLNMTEHAARARTLAETFMPRGESRSRFIALADKLGDSGDAAVMTGREFTEHLLALASGYRAPLGSPAGSVYLTDGYDDGIFLHVFAPGLTDAKFPGKIRQDPVLSDEDIGLINGTGGFHLVTAAEMNSRETEKCRRFIGRAAGTWTGSAPGMDVMDGRVIFPTPLIPWIYERATGKKYSPVELNEYLKKRHVRSSILPGGSADAVNSVEYITAAALDAGTAGHALAGHPGAARIYEAERARWALPGFERHMGMTGDGTPVETLKVSATGATELVQCPYRHFLSKRMGLRENEEPVAAEEIDAMQTGTLVHEILEKFMTAVRDGKPGREKYGEVLAAARERVFSEFLEIFEVKFPVLWEKKAGEIKEYIDNVLAYEMGNTNTPLDFELAFGMNDADPVEVDFGGVKASFTGKIDRVDADGDGFIIIDYKTSNKKKYADGVLKGGKGLQPFLYAEVLKKIKGKPGAPVKAGYFPVKDATEPVLWEYTTDLKRRIDTIFSYIREIIEKGSFFPTGDCEYCPFIPVCGSHVSLQVKRKPEEGRGLVKKYREISEYE